MACKLGYGVGCFKLLNKFEDYKKMATQLCNRGIGYACQYLGYVNKDKAKLLDSCELGDFGGCLAMCVEYTNKNKVREARDYLSKACNQSVKSGVCSDLWGGDLSIDDLQSACNKSSYDMSWEVWSNYLQSIMPRDLKFYQFYFNGNRV